MEQEEFLKLTKDILREQKPFEDAFHKWQDFRDQAFQYNLTHPRDKSLNLEEQKEAAWELTKLDAGEPPAASYELKALYEELSNTVYHQVYKQGVSAGPNLLAVENTEATRGILKITDLSTRLALNARFANGLASLPETVAAYDDLNKKGYVQFDKNDALGVADAATLEEVKKDFMAVKLALPEYRDRVISELRTWPPTPNARAIAEIFLQHPDVIKTLPDTWQEKFVGTNPSTLMIRAAEIAPEVALEQKDILTDNGFGEAIKYAEKSQNPSGIEYSPDAGEQHAELQRVPDARSKNGQPILNINF